MSFSIEAAVRDLVDRAAVSDLLLHYAHAVDRRDLEAVAACFTPGALYKGSLGEGTIEIALAALRDRIVQYASTMHFIGNQLVQIDGDRGAAETYAIAYHRLTGEDGPRNLTVGVRYLDDVVRTPEGWRISKREVRLEWERFDELVLPD